VSKQNKPHWTHTTENGRLYGHVAISPVVNRWAAAAAARIDAAEDRRWFRKHPKQKRRVRPISPREMKATGLPADYVVTVVLRRDGSQVRTISHPRSE
jgi:hypothetical protein